MTEIIAWICLIVLIYPLQMSLQVKIQVVTAFSFRIPMIGLSGLHLYTIWVSSSSSEPQFAVTNTILAQQALLIWSLLSATIPNLGGFMRSFATGFGIMTQLDRNNQHQGQSYALQTIGGSSTAIKASQNQSEVRRTHRDQAVPNSQAQLFRPDLGISETIVLSDGGSGHTERGIGADEDDSQELIIKKRVEWEVRHESPKQPR